MKKLKAADLFCGAGGFTCGAHLSGTVDVILAVNHWRTAIQTHRHNHAGTRHICARIDAIDIRHDASIPDIDMLLASPECTHHSIARGGRPMCDQKRSTAWNVLDWVETKLPKWVIVENVREFRDWGPLTEHGRPIKASKGKIFRQWIASLEAYGYQVDHQILNAADFGAATSRSRLFIVARRGRRKADIPWPEITHPRTNWRPAYEIIDWSKPCPSIFARKKPLADKTLARIEVGLRRFVGDAAEPFLVRHGPDGPKRNYSLHDPLLTLDTQNRYGLVAPYLLVINHGGTDDRSRSVSEPITTLTTKNGHSVVIPFLTKYYGAGGATAVSEPVDTITTKDRFGLAMVSLIQTMQELGVVDIGFRMLDVDELAAAQGFPSDYEVFGTKADQVRQIGNSVSPPVARALCQCYAEAG